MKEIMTPEHKDWEKFCELLEGKEGCDFTQKDPNDIKTLTWKCKGGNDKSLATKILKKHFPNVDINKTMKYFEDNGGHCDCEILFNVGE